MQSVSIVVDSSGVNFTDLVCVLYTLSNGGKVKFKAGVIKNDLRSANRAGYLVAENAFQLDHVYLCVPLNVCQPSR